MLIIVFPVITTMPEVLYKYWLKEQIHEVGHISPILLMMNLRLN